MTARRRLDWLALATDEKALVRELGHQPDQILLERLARRLVLLAERGQHGVETAVLFDEAPHSRARFVQAEIDARREIEDDAFPIELPKDDVLACCER